MGKLGGTKQGPGRGGAKQGPGASAAPAALSPDDMSSSLLPPPASDLPSHFFGQFKGFTLFPIPQKRDESFSNQNYEQGPTGALSSFAGSPSGSTLNRSQTAQISRAAGGPRSPDSAQKLPQRSAPPVPSVPAVAIKLPARGTLAAGVRDAGATCAAPALPPLNPQPPPARPLISSPVLEASTCTAPELLSPLRAAPPAPRRPLSSPDCAANAVSTAHEEPPAAKKAKEGNNTLNRIASFLKQDRFTDKSRHAVERSNSLPKNPNHQVKVVKNIDKSVLRNLQISNPILQKDIDVTVNTVPVVSDSEDPEDPTKMAVTRAQSLRGPALAPRPAIPSFGSMRGRPLSVALGGRPTAPPPPAPAPPTQQLPLAQDKKNLKDNKSPQYDDCVAETHAPLANISEETSPDNIYAIIEESPSSPQGPKRFGRPADPSSATPHKPNQADSMGLLGEIVSEIQNRNFDSIYSTSTLARKKKEKEKREREKSGKVSDEETDGDDTSTYANTSPYRAPSTTSSGYLSPSAVNVPVVKIPPKSGIVSLQVDRPAPEPSAEPYKPFSSTLHRSLGPFASSYSKDKTLPAADGKPAPSRVPTMSRQLTPPSLKNLPLSQKSSTPSLANRLSSGSANSPDLVASCAPSPNGLKSPDVVSSSGSAASKVTNVNQGVILKPALQPAPPAKPTIQTQRYTPKAVSKAWSAPQTGAAGLRSAPAAPAPDKKKSAPARPAPPKVLQNSGADKGSSPSNSALSSKSNSFEKNLSNPNKVSAMGGAGKPKLTPKSLPAKSAVLPTKPGGLTSNVASLQQKFELSKSKGSVGLKKT